MDKPEPPDAQPDDEASGAERRAAHRAGWDARLLPTLTAEWQSANVIAAALGEPQPRVLERLKDMATRGLIERRIWRVPPAQPARKKKKRPRIHSAQFEAHFRLPPS